MEQPGLFLDDDVVAPPFDDRLSEGQFSDGTTVDPHDPFDFGVVDRDDESSFLDLGIQDEATRAISSGAPSEPDFDAVLDADVGAADDRPARIDPFPDPDRIAMAVAWLRAIASDDRDGEVGDAGIAVEREAHALYASWLHDAGFTVRTDPFGNTIGERPGRSDLPALTLGAALDAVTLTAGVAGVVGAVAALEVARTLAASGVETCHPLRIVAFAGSGDTSSGEPTAWTTEEAAAYLGMLADDTGLLGTDRLVVGIVNAPAASTRLRVMVRRPAERDEVAPQDEPRDMLAAAAEMVLAIEQLAVALPSREATVTAGHLTVFPNLPATIPERVDLGIDVRDADPDRQETTVQAIVAQCERIAGRRGALVSCEATPHRAPGAGPHWLARLVQEACSDLGVPYDVVPGQEHRDAPSVTRRVPSVVLLVPGPHDLGVDALSDADADALVLGVRAIAAVLVQLDRALTDGVA